MIKKDIKFSHNDKMIMFTRNYPTMIVLYNADNALSIIRGICGKNIRISRDNKLIAYLKTRTEISVLDIHCRTELCTKNFTLY